MQIFVANKQVDNNFSPPTQSSCEQKMACPSNTPYTILKDGIVLLEHEACQEQPLDILDTFKSRRGTLPISVGSTTE